MAHNLHKRPGKHCIFDTGIDVCDRGEMEAKIIDKSYRGETKTETVGTLPFGYHWLCDPIIHKQQIKNKFGWDEYKIEQVEPVAEGTYIYVAGLPKEIRFNLGEAFDGKLVMNIENEDRSEI